MAEEQTMQEVETTEIKKGKTTIGIKGLNNPTPVWVNWIFRTEFIINKLILMVLSTSSLFTAGQVKESLIWIAAIDYAVWQLGRFVGVSKDDLEK